MPNHSGRAGPATSAGKNQRKLSPRSHSSRVGKAWSRLATTGYKNFKCPVCGEPVRYLKIRGSLEPQIVCSNKLCRWTVDELTRERSIPELAQKPKGVSSRQWYEASRVVG